MEFRITIETVKKLEKYLESENAMISGRESWSYLETHTIFPALRELFLYTGSKKDALKLNDVDFEHVYEQSLNLAYMSNVIAINNRLFDKILQTYKADFQAAVKHVLFSKKLLYMTGYEFQHYLREIGLIDFG